MSEVFYYHLINIEEVITELDMHEIESEEKEELLGLIDQTFHHHILQLILDYLPKEYHETFLTHFHHAPYDPELLIFIKERVVIDIEAVIKTKADQTKKEILAVIKKSKRKKR